MSLGIQYGFVWKEGQRAGRPGFWKTSAKATIPQQLVWGNANSTLSLGIVIVAGADGPSEAHRISFKNLVENFDSLRSEVKSELDKIWSDYRIDPNFSTLNHLNIEDLFELDTIRIDANCVPSIGFSFTGDIWPGAGIDIEIVDGHISNVFGPDD